MHYNKNEQAASGLGEDDHNMTIWIGPKQVGQAFKVLQQGCIEGIDILPEIIPNKGKLTLRLLSFDPNTMHWGEELAHAEQEIETAVKPDWISFHLSSNNVQNEQWYGFQLSFDGGKIAIAEGARRQTNPISSIEWEKFPSKKEEIFHSDFHLSYRIAMVA